MENDKMVHFKWIKIHRMVLWVLCVMTLCTACSSNKTLDGLLSQPMSAYGSDVSLETAVSNLFDDPSWGTEDGSADSNNLTKTVLSGTDRNGDQWVIHFYCNADDPAEWYAEVKVFTSQGYYASFLDEYGSDLLMRYLATGDELYRYGFLDIYSCGDKVEKPYDILDLYGNAGIAPVEKAQAFINQYDDLFPSSLDSTDMTCYLPGELVDWDLDAGGVRKNVSRYGDTLFPVRGLTVSDIAEETASEGQYVTQISAYDDDLRFYHILYCGELPGINLNDVISALVLPVGEQALTNGLGGQTEYLYLLACSVMEGSDLSEIYNSAAGPEERYHAALGYVEMVSEQDALGKEPFFVEDGADPDASFEEYAPVENASSDGDVGGADSGENKAHSWSWECGYERGYDDGWANLDYDDDPTKYGDAIEEAEDYMAGYESGYMTAQYEAINQ